MEEEPEQFIQMEEEMLESEEEGGDFEVLSDESSWISWFCGLEGHEFLIEIEESFMKDKLNLHGL